MPISMYQALEKAIHETPKITALYYKGRKISFARFSYLIDKASVFLKDEVGINKGDVVLISQPNIPESLILLYAVNKIGAVANMVHPYTPYNQLVSIYESSHSKVAFVFEQRVAKEIDKYRHFPYPLYITRIEDYLPFFSRIIYHLFYNVHIRHKLRMKTRTFKTGFKYLYQYKHIKTHFLPSEYYGDDETAVILHSGSTTGDPKDICLSNTAFNSTAYQAYDILCLSKEEVIGKGMLAALPNFHGFGLCMTMHTPLINSFASVLIPKFNAKEFNKAIKGYKKVICVCGVPRIYEALLKDKNIVKNKYLKNIHVCFSGGDVLNPKTRIEFNELLSKAGSKAQLFEGYGLSESTAVITVSTYNHQNEKSIGYPLKNVSIKIVDDNYQEVKSKSVGEILVKADSNMIGYLNDESLNKQVYKDGYLCTGDLGYLDEEGFLYFVSRKKRVIKVSGVAVFPNEVEKLIKEIPGVNDVVVVPIEDTILGHALKAYVVSDYVDKEALREVILETCSKYLIRWSVPKYIEFIKEIPQTMFKKNDYRKLSEH